MTAKAEATDTNRKDGKILAFDVLADTKVYKGAVVTLDGTSKQAQSNDGTTITLANGDIFAGICVETIDNTGGSSGDKSLRVERDGVHRLTFSDTLAATDLGALVFVNNVSDDSVVTITSDTGNPQLTIGKIVEIISTSEARVVIDNYVDAVAANGA